MKNDNKKSTILSDAAMERLMNGADKQIITKSELKKWLVSEYKLSEELHKKKTITFLYATLSKLKKVVNIKQINNKNKFDEWFSYKYKLSDDENSLLKYLIEKHSLSMINYNEIKLIIKFIGQILNKIDFDTNDFTDWYGQKIACELNGYFLSGEPDFVVATGIEVPEKPYFFLQEYKRSIKFTGNPEYQVLAAMLAAMTLNNSNIMRGAYVIGQHWKFIILDKSKIGNYEYFVSKSFDCLDFESLKQIYINLQAVKFLYCK